MLEGRKLSLTHRSPESTIMSYLLYVHYTRQMIYYIINIFLKKFQLKSDPHTRNALDT